MLTIDRKIRTVLVNIQKHITILNYYKVVKTLEEISDVK